MISNLRLLNLLHSNLLLIASNLHVTVLTCSVFIGVSDREEEHGKIRRLKAKKLMEDDLQNYNDWLRIAGNLSRFKCSPSSLCVCDTCRFHSVEMLFVRTLLL